MTPKEPLSNENNLHKIHGNFTSRDVGPVYPPRQLSLHNSLNEILAYARNENVSDVHIASRNPIFFRKFTRLTAVNSNIYTSEHIYKLLLEVLPQEIFKTFIKTGDMEYVHTVYSYGRFRLTLIKQRNGFEITARLIPMEIPKFASTGMPVVCATLIQWFQGIVLVTGPAGSGKTTTLAVLLEMINQRRNSHIITIEDPIEILFEPNLCQISQRQMNIHTRSQNDALRAALREDPDIIMIGELRDMQTLHLAISAAETGHLVFATMNTINASQTLSRIIESFPNDEQQSIRNLISESLRGVISQRLIPRKDGSGVAVAYEILINTPSIENHIRKDTLSQIENSIATSKSSGMVLMSTSLQKLVTDDLITQEEANAYIL